MVDRYRPRTWLDWLLVLVICSLIPVYALYVSTPAVGFWHDDGVYLVNAKSLATHQGYRTISLPSEPQQTKYPILYPALLAAIWKLFPSFPQNVILFKLLSLVGVALWCGALYYLVLQDSPGNGKRLALWIAVLTAASQWTIWMSGAVLPDSLFCFCTTAAIVLLTRSLRRHDAYLNRDLLAGALLAGAAFLLRTAGGPLLLTAILVLLVRKRFRGASVFALTIIFLVGPWLVWQRIQATPVDPVEAYYTKASYAAGHVFAGFSASETGHIVTANILLLLFHCLPAGASPANTALVALSALIGLVAARQIVQSFRTRLNIVNAWLCVYTVMILCWISFPIRYGLPLIPFTCLYAWYAVRDRLESKSGMFSRACGMVFLIGFLCLDAELVSEAVVNTIATGTPSLAQEPPDIWANTVRLTEWMKHNSPADSVVTGHLDPTLYLYAHRSAVRPYVSNFSRLLYGTPTTANPVGTAEDFRRNLLRHRITFIVMMPARWFRESNKFIPVLAETMREHPKAFSLAYRLPDPGYFILAVHLEQL